MRIGKALSLKEKTVGNWLYNNGIPNGKESNTHKPNLEPSSALSYVIGAVFGDGFCYSNGRGKCICLTVKDHDFADEFNRNICKILNKKHLYKIYKRKDGRFAVRATSKNLFRFLKQGLERLKPTIEKHPSHFIRGLADAEACIHKHAHWQAFAMVNTDLALLIYAKKLLIEKFKIPSKISKMKNYDISRRKDTYRLTFYSYVNMERFYQYVGFSIKRKQAKLAEVVEAYDAYQKRRASKSPLKKQ